MNLKTTYILFGALLAVLLLFAATQFSGCEKAGDEKGGYLFADFHAKKEPVKTDEIDLVRIDRPAANSSLVFKREKGVWQMTDPFAARTDAYQVNRVVDEVTGAKREQSEMTSNLGQYGLNEPKIVVTLKKGDQEWKLNVGDDTGKNGVAYVTTGANPKKPVAVSRGSIDAVFNAANDFRDKSLLSVNAFNATAVELDAKGATLALEKVGEGRWHFQKPAYGPANMDSDLPPTPLTGQKPVGGVRDLIDDAGGLRVEATDDFVAEGVSDADLAAKYGLEKGKPETLRVEVKVKPPDGDAKTEVLLVGKKAPKPVEEKKDDKKETKKEEKKPETPPDYYYVRLEGENTVERVPAAKVQPLLDVVAKPDPLRSHDLITLGGSSKIDAIDISAGGSAVKLRQVDGKWTLYHGGARATDEAAVRDLVEAITGKKKVLTFVDKEDGLEFDKPAAVVSVWIDGVKKEEKKAEEKKGEEKKDGEKPEEKKDEKKEDKNKEPTLTSDKPSVKLTFGKRDRDKNLVYVRRESGEDKSIVTVSDSVLDKVTAGPLTYFDRKLASFSDAFGTMSNVTKLKLVRGGQTWELTKEKAGDKEVWKVVQPQALAGRSASDASVNDVLRTLAGLRAEKMVAEKPNEGDLDQLYGLKKPETTATVTVKEEKGDKTEDWVYTFGKQSDTKMGVYAELNKTDLVFLVPKATADHLAAVDLRDLTVFNFDMSKVKGAKITVWSNDLGGPITLTLERKGDNDWVKKEGPITPDGPKLESFIRTLSHLTATKFVTPKQNVDAGLDVDKKALKVEITVGDETLDLLVGNEDPDNKGMLFASSSKQKGDVFLVPEAMFKEAKAGPAYFRK
jgi:hypothetical protein